MDNILKQISKATKLDKKTLLHRALKLSEETGELAQAVLSNSMVSGCTYKNKTNDDIIEEAVDIILIASSIIFSVNGTKDIKTLFETKIDKWTNKVKGV